MPVQYITRGCKKERIDREGERERDRKRKIRSD